MLDAILHETKPEWGKGDWIICLATSPRPIFQAEADPEWRDDDGSPQWLGGWWFGPTRACMFRKATPEDVRKQLEKLYRRASRIEHEIDEAMNCLAELEKADGQRE